LKDTASAVADALAIIVALEGDYCEESALESAENLAQSLVPAQEWAVFLRARATIATERKNYEVAIRLWNEILRVTPDSYEAMLKRTASAVDGEIESPTAKIYCDELLRLSPKSDTALALRGRWYLKNKRFLEAKQDFTDALILCSDTASRRGEIFIRRCQARAMMAEPLDSVLQDLRNAVRLAFNEAWVLHNAGITFYNYNCADSAEKYLTAALVLDSTRYSSLRRRAEIYDERHDFRRAAQDYSRCITIQLNRKGSTVNPNALAELYACRAQCRSLLKDSLWFEDAFASLAKHPNERAYSMRGFWYKRERYFAEALRDFDSAFTMNPKFYQERIWAAQCLYQLSHYSQALLYLDCVFHNASTNNTLQASAYFLRAQVKAALGDVDGACSDLHYAASKGSDTAHDLLQDCWPEQDEKG
jgi:tetratricopeptide (TPR) repeat protein